MFLSVLSNPVALRGLFLFIPLRTNRREDSSASNSLFTRTRRSSHILFMYVSFVRDASRCRSACLIKALTRLKIWWQQTHISSHLVSNIVVSRGNTGFELLAYVVRNAVEAVAVLRRAWMHGHIYQQDRNTWSYYRCLKCFHHLLLANHQLRKLFREFCIFRFGRRDRL